MHAVSHFELYVMYYFRVVRLSISMITVDFAKLLKIFILVYCNSLSKSLFHRRNQKKAYLSVLNIPVWKRVALKNKIAHSDILEALCGLDDQNIRKSLLEQQHDFECGADRAGGAGQLRKE